MGVPYYFKYLVENVGNCVIKRIANKPTILYLDFNGIVYEAKANIMKTLPETTPKMMIEYHIITEVVKLMEKVIDSIGIHKVMMVYIAIDGVAPMAKMVQQRQRRFKSVFESQLLADIAKTENVEKHYPIWDTNAITPGTKFMQRLTDHLKAYIDSCLPSISSKVEFVLSSSDEPGEGEHKLLTHLEKHREEHKEYQKVVYGLDADLIILTLLRNFQYTYLYRESTYFPFELGGPRKGRASSTTSDVVSYLYMDVAILRSAILAEFYKEPMDKARLLVDYVCLTYFVGNDFLPNLFILKIQNGGFELLADLYKKGYDRFHRHLVSPAPDYKIDAAFLRYILAGLLKKEDGMMKEYAHDHARYKPFLNPKLSSYELKCAMVHHYPHSVCEVDTIQLGESGWHERFYEYWLDGKVDTFMIRGMVEKYMEGLSWILKYYCVGCPDWRWYYPFPVAPTIRDFLAMMPMNIDSIHTQFDASNSIIADIRVANLFQLLTILPKNSNKVMPKEWRTIMNLPQLLYLYPTQFPIKTLYRRFYHECYPVLPKLDGQLYSLVEKCVKKYTYNIL